MGEIGTRVIDSEFVADLRGAAPLAARGEITSGVSV